ncbi:regulatory protein RecX [Stappia sp. ES.058]|uniref:regulatory protein RecX n=1 Tax=Stappia sp. ES.058 TaxID=1881061 RepID=UPI000879A553|nr:regulatory protein RecX [Stappia sp. ES.058]SDU09419.1 regulatory protein [Stappia sp. ES.058]
MTRKMRAPTEERLMRAALHYLDRYGSSAGNLRRVLERKVWRVAAALEEDPATFAHLIDIVVSRCEASGLVDDRLYAESKIISERRKGRSARRIAAVLQTKGISQEMAETLLARDETTDLAAACIAARKKRFGPWRKGGADTERQRKEIASLCRQGFRLSLARKVVEASDSDTLLSDTDET